MNEIAEVPITREQVDDIAKSVRKKPRSPVVVPVSYARVTVPKELPACIMGVLRDPGSYMLDDTNVAVGRSLYSTDEYGRIYDGIFKGITVDSLLQSIPESVTALWALHLNLADPSMPHKLNEFHKTRQEIGLVAVVIPNLASTYLKAFSEFNPLLHQPVRGS